MEIAPDSEKGTQVAILNPPTVAVVDSAMKVSGNFDRVVVPCFEAGLALLAGCEADVLLVSAAEVPAAGFRLLASHADLLGVLAKSNGTMMIGKK